MFQIVPVVAACVRSGAEDIRDDPLVILSGHVPCWSGKFTLVRYSREHALREIFIRRGVLVVQDLVLSSRPGWDAPTFAVLRVSVRFTGFLETVLGHVTVSRWSGKLATAALSGLSAHRKEALLSRCASAISALNYATLNSAEFEISANQKRIRIRFPSVLS